MIITVPSKDNQRKLKMNHFLYLPEILQSIQNFMESIQNYFLQNLFVKHFLLTFASVLHLQCHYLSAIIFLCYLTLIRNCVKSYSSL